MTYGCIGRRLPHSFSKEIHQKLGPENYDLIELEPEDVEPFLQKKDFKAINVTIPYKETVIPYLTYISETAAAIGAVNTVVNHGGELYGFNTDCAGLTALIQRNVDDLTGKKALVLGTGGTAKTAVYTLKTLGAAEVYKVSRNPKGEGVVSYEDAKSLHADAFLIVNATPVGMFPKIDESPLDLARFASLGAAIDAVYNPLRTRFVLEAHRLGLRAEGGLYMLVEQAVRAYELFHLTTLPQGTTERVYKEILANKENVVLVGMPGCGKSAIARLLAGRTGREALDTDKLVFLNEGRRPADVIREDGEKAFRDFETEAVREVSSRSGVVIATGGGAVLREENVRLLKMNGRIYFRDRPIDCIRPTPTRPLSADPEALKKRYEERLPLYIAAADETVDTGDDLQAAVDEIERRHFS